MPWTREFDEIFAKYGKGLPVAFLRALAKNESGFDPNSDMGKGKAPNAAKGILQVMGGVREDFNLRMGTSFNSQDLFDPIICTRIASAALTRFIFSYARNHPDSLGTDWTDRRWVELVVFGWNAGYSEKGGVGKAVYILEKNGIRGPKVTIDAVHEVALANPDKISANLRRADKVAWSKGVARDFFVQRAQDTRKDLPVT